MALSTEVIPGEDIREGIRCPGAFSWIEDSINGRYWGGDGQMPSVLVSGISPARGMKGHQIKASMNERRGEKMRI